MVLLLDPEYCLVHTILLDLEFLPQTDISSEFRRLIALGSAWIGSIDNRVVHFVNVFQFLNRQHG